MERWPALGFAISTKLQQLPSLGGGLVGSTHRRWHSHRRMFCGWGASADFEQRWGHSIGCKSVETFNWSVILTLPYQWSCHGSRHFLRELLFSTILVPSINFVSDPDSLNQLALTILNSSTNPAMVVSEEPESAREQSPAEHKQTVQNYSKFSNFHKIIKFKKINNWAFWGWWVLGQICWTLLHSHAGFLAVSETQWSCGQPIPHQIVRDVLAWS